MTDNKSGMTPISKTLGFSYSQLIFFGKHKLSYYVALKFPTDK